MHQNSETNKKSILIRQSLSTPYVSNTFDSFTKIIDANPLFTSINISAHKVGLRGSVKLIEILGKTPKHEQ
ncbi:7438_t:CDS:2 [Gigaspora margarita]|uniref:7438_t:CDS:1 n=1 Tax=Gigaspora margarita TaxID=4874 RepID=A0ABN7USI3_GIGMA|nr:7438_t:CDS:2 [Gigaspora margarita]